jgi:uncharacterized Zn finger protein
MFTLPLTEAMVRQHATGESWQRGQQYGREGAVLALVQRGNALEGEVQGSADDPYRIRCVHLPDGQWQATCTCPYAYEGWCKHIVAACLTALRFPAKVPESSALADQLAMLTPPQLVALVVRLAEQDPPLTAIIEGLIEQVGDTAGTPAFVPPTPRRPPPDLTSIRRQVQAAAPQHSTGYSRRWGDGAGWDIAALHTLQPVLERVQDDIAADDGATALAVLEALTDPLVANFEDFIEYDEEGESVDILRAVGDLWLDAIVTANLDATMRIDWAGKLADWQSAARDFDDAFDAALAATEQGWDFPPLRRVLQGETTRSIWPDDAPPYADAVTAARLRVLARRGQTEEYLRLARTEGQVIAYTTMLAQVQRVDEALAAGIAMLNRPAEALILAQALFAQGAREPAFQMAEHGLTLPDPSPHEMMAGYPYEWHSQQGKVNLAVWLRDVAAAAGEMERALAAARIAFKEEISLANYQRVRDLAGAAWPTLRDGLLAVTRQPKPYPAEGVIDVLLAEDLIDDAIAALGKGHVPHELLARVADAALPTRPDWVRDIASKKAENLMDEGKSKYYADAARWLERARDAFRVLGEDVAWRTYHAEILARYKRKYTLRPLIEKLGT